MLFFLEKKCCFPVILFFFLQSQNVYAWQPDSLITGKWQCKSEIFADFKKGEFPSNAPEDYFEISIIINKDCVVEGRIGNAKFVNCVVKKNRSWFGRLIKIRTDYIITHGYLDGKINSLDNETKRVFTIPFNIYENNLQGSFMVRKRWEYPSPMFPRMKMVRIL